MSALRAVSLLVGTGGVVLEPRDIRIIWRNKVVVNVPVGHEPGHRAIIAPAVNLRMTVSKGESARQVMVKSGQVVKTILSGIVWPSPHPLPKVSHVNAVFTHVQKNEYFARTWAEYLT